MSARWTCWPLPAAKSPAEIRRLNFLAIGDSTAAGQELTASVGITKCLERGPGGRGRLCPPTPARCNPQWLTAWGLGATYYGIGLTGLPNPGAARLTLTPQGEVDSLGGHRRRRPGGLHHHEDDRGPGAGPRSPTQVAI